MNINAQEGRVFESVSFKTVRNHISVLMIYMLTAGNFSIMNSTISNDQVVNSVIIMTSICLAILLLNYILFSMTKSETLVTIYLLFACISVYVALGILYIDKAGVTLLLSLILIMTLFYSLHFNLGILVISIIHILSFIFYSVIIGPTSIDITYGHYIAAITVSILALYFTFVNDRLYRKYMEQMNTHISTLATQNSKLEHLNEELRAAKGNLNEQYHKTSDLNKKNATLSAKFRSLVDLANEGIIDYNIENNELALSDVAMKLLNVSEAKHKDWAQIAENMTERSLSLFSQAWNNLLEATSQRETLIIDYMTKNKVINLKIYLCAYNTEFSDEQFIVGTIQDVTDELRESLKANHLAFHDFVTNLPNRSHFIDLLHQDFSSFKNDCCSLICLNIDDFKSFNRNHGYENGNRMLNLVAEALVNTFENSRISRIYSNTFALMIHHIDSLEDTIIYIQKMLAHLAMLNFNIADFTATLGAVIFNPKTETAIESILLDAEKNIYLVREETGKGGQFKITEL